LIFLMNSTSLLKAETRIKLKKPMKYGSFELYIHRCHRKYHNNSRDSRNTRSVNHVCNNIWYDRFMHVTTSSKWKEIMNAKIFSFGLLTNVWSKPFFDLSHSYIIKCFIKKLIKLLMNYVNILSLTWNTSKCGGVW
jgi:hypothetical protein